MPSLQVSYFVEQPDTMMNDFREIAPTFVLFAPRLWESIAADVRAGVMDSSPLKQKLYDLGMKTGLAALAEGKRDLKLKQALLEQVRLVRFKPGTIEISPLPQAPRESLEDEPIPRAVDPNASRPRRTTVPPRPRAPRRAGAGAHRDEDRGNPGARQ